MNSERQHNIITFIIFPQVLLFQIHAERSECIYFHL
jgi:hypothetical protein